MLLRLRSWNVWNASHLLANACNCRMLCVSQPTPPELWFLPNVVAVVCATVLVDCGNSVCHGLVVCGSWCLWQALLSPPTESQCWPGCHRHSKISLKCVVLSFGMRKLLPRIPFRGGLLLTFVEIPGSVIRDHVRRAEDYWRGYKLFCFAYYSHSVRHEAEFRATKMGLRLCCFPRRLGFFSFCCHVTIFFGTGGVRCGL